MENYRYLKIWWTFFISFFVKSKRRLTSDHIYFTNKRNINPWDRTQQRSSIQLFLQLSFMIKKKKKGETVKQVLRWLSDTRNIDEFVKSFSWTTLGYLIMNNMEWGCYSSTQLGSFSLLLVINGRDLYNDYA